MSRADDRRYANGSSEEDIAKRLQSSQIAGAIVTPEDAFELINNLDVRESLRKFAPQWCTVAVDQSGTIVDVIRHKEPPNDRLHKEHMNRHPLSVQFTAWPGRFAGVDELETILKECVDAHRQY